MTSTQLRRTAQRKRAFLAAYAQAGNISRACQLAKVARRTYYEWMEKDPDFVVAFAAADEIAIDALETEARRRAVEGTDKPVYQNGQMVGVIREYSDTLLIFLMKGARPSKYRDRVDIHLDIRREAERLAASLDGVTADELIADAERIMAEGKR